MKQSKIIRAYKTLSKISQDKLPLAVSHKLWTLSRILQPHWDFQTEKEADVFRKYDPKYNEDGTMDFGSEERAKECRAEYEQVVTEIADLDVDLGDFKKVVLHLDDKLDISIGDIEALSDFVEFVE